MTWFAAAFLALIGVLVIVQRRALARAQAMVLGGTIVPGCAVVEGVALLLIALAIVLYG